MGHACSPECPEQCSSHRCNKECDSPCLKNLTYAMVPRKRNRHNNTVIPVRGDYLNKKFIDAVMCQLEYDERFLFSTEIVK